MAEFGDVCGAECAGDCSRCYFVRLRRWKALEYGAVYAPAPTLPRFQVLGAEQQDWR
jgi:hypothetical protein